MGVANHRSIAWACVESLRRNNFEVILTCQDDRTLKALDTLLARDPGVSGLSCNVETDLPILLEQQIPELLSEKKGHNNATLNAIVHSVANASYQKDSNNANTSLQISNASWDDFGHAQHVSAFSLLETAKLAKPLLSSYDENDNVGSSITTLTYLGAVRAVPNYHLMGPAKASLEACVRGLAVELGPTHHCRVNAVSAGPLRTLSARGIPQFTDLYHHVEEKAPLRRNVTQQEVADTVAFLATEGTGITGQTLYVDGGYSSIVPL